MSQIGNAILFRNRYRRLYSLSVSLDTGSFVVRIASALTALVVPIASAFFFAQRTPGARTLAWRLLAAGLAAAVTGYLLARLLAALSLLLRASADTAVNGSPFISAEMKALLLSRTSKPRRERTRVTFPIDPALCSEPPARDPALRSERLARPTAPARPRRIQPKQLPASTKPAA